MPPPDLDDPSEFPEEKVFSQVLSPWSKGAITYKRWIDEPLDVAFQMANDIIDDSKKRAEEMKKLQARSKARR